MRCEAFPCDAMEDCRIVIISSRKKPFSSVLKTETGLSMLAILVLGTGAANSSSCAELFMMTS
jgi:hypothetical protein